MKIKTITMLVGLSLSSSVMASTDMEMLMKVLESKGVVTNREAQEILKETQDAMEIQKSEQTAAKEHSLASEEAIAALEKIKFNGDLRLREDIQAYDTTTIPEKEDRNRQRYRARFGFTYGMDNDTEFGIGLASGEQDVGSTNQTMDNGFDPKAIYLDKAYIHQSFLDKNIELTMGKFENPFQPSSWLVWDTDVRFEGVATRFNQEFGDNKLNASVGFFPLDEDKNNTGDPFLSVLQLGAEGDLLKDTKYKTRLAYYHYEDVQGISSGTAGDARSGNTIGEQYGVINFTNEFNLKGTPVPMKIVGDYVYNTRADDLNQGWLLGVDLGNKVKAAGDLQGFLTYSVLEADATYDRFTDSDFHSGGTNNEGWTTGYIYGLGKGWTHELKYYDTRENTGVQKEEQRVQADLIYKF